jgi:hypothetical protein
MKPQPMPGELWRHHSGRLYKVLMLTNTAHDNPRFPVTVVYENTTNGTQWSRPLAGFNDKFTLYDRAHEA